MEHLDPELRMAMERPPVVLDFPEGSKPYRVDFDEEVKTMPLINALAAGNIIQTTQGGGIVYVWKVDNKYRGVLLQYRLITNDRNFDDAVSAIDWFISTAQSVR